MKCLAGLLNQHGSLSGRMFCSSLSGLVPDSLVTPHMAQPGWCLGGSMSSIKHRLPPIKCPLPTRGSSISSPGADSHQPNMQVVPALTATEHNQDARA